MQLIHYSNKKLKKVESRFDWIADPSYDNFKPHGLWVSDKSSEYCWEWWCRNEGFRLRDLRYKTLIKLKDNANILILDSIEKIRDFTDEFIDEKFFYKYRNEQLNWQSVAKKYDGVIITPYQWDLRYELSWYYAWDCASGCIWNADAIGSIEPIIVERLKNAE